MYGKVDPGITNNHVIHTLWLDGYDTGLRWPDNWEPSIPGGPWSDGTQQLTAERKAWVEGWLEGHKEKLRRKETKNDK